MSMYDINDTKWVKMQGRTPKFIRSYHSFRDMKHALHSHHDRSVMLVLHLYFVNEYTDLLITIVDNEKLPAQFHKFFKCLVFYTFHVRLKFIKIMPCMVH